MQAAGIRHYYKPLLLICLLAFIIGVYFSAESKTDKEISAKITRHLELITIANEISSYAKRAEGHFLLFLILEDNEDRKKFFTRIDTLQEYIGKLEAVISDKTSLQYAEDMKHSLRELQSYGETILRKYDAHTNNGKKFVYNSQRPEIISLHAASSTIRKLGVSIVNNSTKLLDQEKIEISEKNKLKYQTIGGLTLITFLFLIVISYQTGKLTITEKMTRSLEKISYLDSLTGIPNRRSFDEQFDKEWQRAIRHNTSLAMLFIDVDHFKKYNDSYGHSAGDNCLIRIAQCIQKCLQRPSDIAARYGGEEFVVILPETSNPELIAEKCRASIHALKIPHKSVPSKLVSVSIGVGSVKPVQESKSNDFINLVDKALYQAKEAGRNCVKIATNNT